MRAMKTERDSIVYVSRWCCVHFEVDDNNNNDNDDE